MNRMYHYNRTIDRVVFFLLYIVVCFLFVSCSDVLIRDSQNTVDSVKSGILSSVASGPVISISFETTSARTLAPDPISTDDFFTQNSGWKLYLSATSSTGNKDRLSERVVRPIKTGEHQAHILLEELTMDSGQFLFSGLWEFTLKAKKNDKLLLQGSSKVYVSYQQLQEISIVLKAEDVAKAEPTLTGDIDVSVGFTNADYTKFVPTGSKVKIELLNKSGSPLTQQKVTEYATSTRSDNTYHYFSFQQNDIEPGEYELRVTTTFTKQNENTPGTYIHKDILYVEANNTTRSTWLIPQFIQYPYNLGNFTINYEIRTVDKNQYGFTSLGYNVGLFPVAWTGGYNVDYYEVQYMSFLSSQGVISSNTQWSSVWSRSSTRLHLIGDLAKENASQTPPLYYYDSSAAKIPRQLFYHPEQNFIRHLKNGAQTFSVFHEAGYVVYMRIRGINKFGTGNWYYPQSGTPARDPNLGRTW